MSFENLWAWLVGFHQGDKPGGAMWYGLFFIHHTHFSALCYFAATPQKNAKEGIYCDYLSDNL